MREADLMYSRRRFLLTSVKAVAGVTAGLIVGPQVFEMLDQMGPRRLLVPGYSKPLRWGGAGVYWDWDIVMMKAIVTA